MNKQRNFKFYKEKLVNEELIKQLDTRPTTVIHKDANRVANLMALLSLLISLCIGGGTIYFQFIKTDYTTSVTCFNGSAHSDTLLYIDVIYHNQGNQYSSILRNNIILYQVADSVVEDPIREEKVALEFKNSKNAIYEDLGFDPVVLTPGQQIHRHITQNLNFTKEDFKYYKLNTELPIKLGLIIGFTNDKGFHATNLLKIGWLKVDKSLKLKSWLINYNTITLNSNQYLSDTYHK